MNFNLNKNFIANNFRDLGIFNLKISSNNRKQRKFERVGFGKLGGKIKITRRKRINKKKKNTNKKKKNTNTTSINKKKSNKKKMNKERKYTRKH